MEYLTGGLLDAWPTWLREEQCSTSVVAKTSRSTRPSSGVLVLLKTKMGMLSHMFSWEIPLAGNGGFSEESRHHGTDFEL